MTSLRETSAQVLELLRFLQLENPSITTAADALEQAIREHEDYLKHSLEEEWRNGYKVGKIEAQSDYIEGWEEGYTQALKEVKVVIK
jgi:flagellar biosynthesis/type III secretory pathway protein FliH